MILLDIKYWGLVQKHIDFINYGDIIVNNTFGIFVKGQD
jgi:hypothetical protein